MDHLHVGQFTGDLASEPGDGQGRVQRDAGGDGVGNRINSQDGP